MTVAAAMRAVRENPKLTDAEIAGIIATPEAQHPWGVTDLNTATPSQLAAIIRRDWKPVYFGAVPYLDAMGGLTSWDQDYGMDPGRSIGLYFLSNASTWRGPVARAVKAAMKKQLGVKS